MLTQVLPNSSGSIQNHTAPLKKLWLQLTHNGNEHAYLDCLQQSLYASLGIVSCQINASRQQILLYFDPFTANLAQVRKIIEDAGFIAEPILD
jgi:hypothetical protein